MTGKIKVKLYANLRIKSPIKVNLGEAFPVYIKEGFTIENLLKFLDISDKEAKIIMINGIGIFDLNHILVPDDLVVIFPPAGGG